MEPNVITLTDDEMGMLIAMIRNTIADTDNPMWKHHMVKLHDAITEQRRDHDGMEVC